MSEKKNNHTIYKKVRKEGGSVVLSMGNCIPKDWRIVKISLISEVDDNNEVWRDIRVEKVA